MFLTDRTIERQLFAFNVRDLVANDSDVWLYIDLFDSINLHSFDSIYSDQGQHPIDPKLMLRTIFYGLTHGVVSGVKLETACRNDNRFIVLSGDLRPDRRTFHRFLVRHSTSIEDFFSESVELAQKMGLVKLGRVALDGSRFKANTAQHRSMAYGKMERACGHIKDELLKLKQDLALDNARQADLDDRLEKQIANREERLRRIEKAKEQIENERKSMSEVSKSDKVTARARKSLNDPEALSLGKKGQGSIFGYNVQAAVDAEKQIIVACDLHNQATDYQALPSLIEAVQQNCGAAPEQILADNGYKSAANVRSTENSGSEPIIAVSGGKKAGQADPDIEFFEQIAATDEPHRYTCLAGKTLPLQQRKKNGATEFRFPKGFCEGCPFSKDCKGFGRKTIGIPEEQDRLALIRLLRNSRTESFKEAYKKRKAIVEPVFGNIKNKGMSILVTRSEKVRLWWRMACTAHNLEKIVKANQLALT